MHISDPVKVSGSDDVRLGALIHYMYPAYLTIHTHTVMGLSDVYYIPDIVYTSCTMKAMQYYIVVVLTYINSFYKLKFFFFNFLLVSNALYLYIFQIHVYKEPLTRNRIRTLQKLK
jgi:hypothetical protein